MSSLSRLRHVFAVNPSSISAATTLAVKPKPDHEPAPVPKPNLKPDPKPESASKPKTKANRKWKPKRRPVPSLETVPSDYETPEGLRNVVDKFKELCSNKLFRRRSSVYIATVRRFAKAQAFPLIEEIIEAQKQYEEITTEGFVVRLMSLYGRAGMLDNVRKLFEEMPSFNCNRTNMSFSALLNAFVAAKRYDAVPELFREISSKHSIQPDVVSFNVVVHAYCRMGSLDSALGVLHEMEELGLEPNVVTFNTLLSAFYQKDGFDAGEKIWTMMKTRNVEHDVVSYRLKMSAMVADGRTNDAVELFEGMRASGIKPDVYCFNVLIKEFVNDDKVEDAKHWYDELVRCECTPDRSTYVTLVPFLSEKGDLDLAFQLCKAALTGRRLLINAEELKQVVDTFVANGMMEAATELADLVREKKLKVDYLLNSM